MSPHLPIISILGSSPGGPKETPTHPLLSITSSFLLQESMDLVLVTATQITLQKYAHNCSGMCVWFLHLNVTINQYWSFLLQALQYHIYFVKNDYIPIMKINAHFDTIKMLQLNICKCYLMHNSCMAWHVINSTLNLMLFFNLMIMPEIAPFKFNCSKVFKSTL